MCRATGNDNLAALTAVKRYVLRVNMEDWSYNRRWAEYNSLRVMWAEDDYQLNSLGDYSGDAGH